MAVTDTTHFVRQRQRKAEEREFRTLLRIGFVFFLVLLTFKRLATFLRLIRRQPDTRKLSIIAEARQAANNTIPYAFYC